MNKLASRKFWVSVAAFLASIGASLTGYFTENDTVMVAGIVCTMLSAAIYAAVEAFVDGKYAEANITVNEFTENRAISATGNTPTSIKAVSDNFYPQNSSAKEFTINITGTGDENAVS